MTGRHAQPRADVHYDLACLAVAAVLTALCIASALFTPGVVQ